MIFLETILESIIISIISAYYIFYYAKKDVPLYVKFIVFISWQLAFQTISILAMDIYYVFFLLLANG